MSRNGLLAGVLSRLADSLYALRRYLLKRPFFTGTVLPAIPRPLRWAMRTAYLLPAEFIERVVGRQSDLVPPRSKMFVGAVDSFESSGEEIVRQLTEVAGLTPASCVLDIGCGIGRLAVALTSYLGPQGRYEGLDIVPTGIEWCAENVTPRYPNFRFTLADVINREYNPNGRVPPTEYRLPYPDATFDVVVLVSVFTHMLPAEKEHYVDEIARVLKPDGRCFASYLLLNPESRQRMEAGAAVTRLKHEMGPCAVVDRKIPELSVGYDESYVLEVYEQRGLSTANGVYYGSWSGRPPSEGTFGVGQDVVLTTKR